MTNVSGCWGVRYWDAWRSLCYIISMDNVNNIICAPCLESNTVSLSGLITISKWRAFWLGWARQKESACLGMWSHIPSRCGVLLLPHSSAHQPNPLTITSKHQHRCSKEWSGRSIPLLKRTLCRVDWRALLDLSDLLWVTVKKITLGRVQY